MTYLVLAYATGTGAVAPGPSENFSTHVITAAGDGTGAGYWDNMDNTSDFFPGLNASGGSIDNATTGNALTIRCAVDFGDLLFFQLSGTQADSDTTFVGIEIVGQATLLRSARSSYYTVGPSQNTSVWEFDPSGITFTIGQQYTIKFYY